MSEINDCLTKDERIELIGLTFRVQDFGTLIGMKISKAKRVTEYDDFIEAAKEIVEDDKKLNEMTARMNFLLNKNKIEKEQNK